MGKLMIVDVKDKPWWKFWTTDNLEVTLEEAGKQRTITVYALVPIVPQLLEKQILEKHYTGDQFWSLHQAQRRVLEKVMLLVGKEFDEDVLKAEYQRRHMKERPKPEEAEDQSLETRSCPERVRRRG